MKLVTYFTYIASERDGVTWDAPVCFNCAMKLAQKDIKIKMVTIENDYSGQDYDYKNELRCYDCEVTLNNPND